MGVKFSLVKKKKKKVNYLLSISKGLGKAYSVHTMVEWVHYIVRYFHLCSPCLSFFSFVSLSSFARHTVD